MTPLLIYAVVLIILLGLCGIYLLYECYINSIKEEERTREWRKKEEYRNSPAYYQKLIKEYRYNEQDYEQDYKLKSWERDMDELIEEAGRKIDTLTKETVEMIEELANKTHNMLW